MPRKRLKENEGLPKHWRFYHGAYYYRVPKGLEHLWDGQKQFRLGATLQEAYRTWADRLDTQREVRNLGDLLDRYTLEVVPTKAAKTQTENRRHIKRLRPVFGHLPLHAVEPQHIYQYVDRRRTPAGQKPKTVAHREIEVLSHAYTKAVEWGYIKRHPFLHEVRLEGSPPRDRYVEDWEIIECLALPRMRKRGSVLAIQAYIRLKLLTGLSQGDLLRLQPERDFRADGIHNQRHKTKGKTGKRTIYEWDDVIDPETGEVTPGPLRRAVQMALVARTTECSSFLFCNRSGEGYVNEELGEARGWKSMWQRFMERVLRETKVEQPFTEHDLRAKVASDAETLEHARALLAHADARTTHRIYRRKPERVKPLANAI